MVAINMDEQSPLAGSAWCEVNSHNWLAARGVRCSHNWLAARGVGCTVTTGWQRVVWGARSPLAGSAWCGVNGHHWLAARGVGCTVTTGAEVGPHFARFFGACLVIALDGGGCKLEARETARAPFLGFLANPEIAACSLRDFPRACRGTQVLRCESKEER